MPKDDRFSRLNYDETPHLGKTIDVPAAKTVPDKLKNTIDLSGTLPDKESEKIQFKAPAELFEILETLDGQKNLVRSYLLCRGLEAAYEDLKHDDISLTVKTLRKKIASIADKFRGY